jgi:hypothetical protein
MNNTNNDILCPLFIQLPDDIKRIIFKYVLITPSARAVKEYIGWYKNYLNWNKEPKCFINYCLKYLKPLDRDIFLSLINYKISKKSFNYSN